MKRSWIRFPSLAFCFKGQTSPEVFLFLCEKGNFVENYVESFHGRRAKIHETRAVGPAFLKQGGAFMVAISSLIGGFVLFALSFLFETNGWILFFGVIDLALGVIGINEHRWLAILGMMFAILAVLTSFRSGIAIFRF